METAEWIAKMQARCDAASPGPWTEEREQDGTDDGWEDGDYATGRVWGPPAPFIPGEDYDVNDDTVLICEEGRDAEFVATARTALPVALAALRVVLDLCEDHAYPGGVQYIDPRELLAVIRDVLDDQQDLRREQDR